MPPPPTAARSFTRRSIRRGVGTSVLGIAVAGAMHIVGIASGDRGDCFWILAEGRITAERERDDASRFRLETLVPGQVLGEVGFVTGEPRSVHLVADEESALYRKNRDGWEALARQRPELALPLRDMLLRLTAERVKHLSAVLAATGA